MCAERGREAPPSGATLGAARVATDPSAARRRREQTIGPAAISHSGLRVGAADADLNAMVGGEPSSRATRWVEIR
jgi:hypothetical protein